MPAGSSSSARGVRGSPKALSGPLGRRSRHDRRRGPLAAGYLVGGPEQAIEAAARSVARCPLTRRPVASIRRGTLVVDDYSGARQAGLIDGGDHPGAVRGECLVIGVVLQVEAEMVYA